MQSHVEVGTALRKARLALAWPIEKLARDLKVSPAQLRALEGGSPGPFVDLAERALVTRLALGRLELPLEWVALQPPWVAAAGASSLNSSRSAAPPPVRKPGSRPKRLFALAAASAVVLGTVATAFIRVEQGGQESDETQLEDLRTIEHSKSTTAVKDFSGAAQTTIAMVPEGRLPQAPKSTEVLAPAPTAPTTTNRAPGLPYAVLPGSRIELPQNPVLDLRVRAPVTVALQLAYGPTQLSLQAGDRIVLMTGPQPERIQVSDRSAVDLKLAGTTVKLDPVAGEAQAGNWNAPQR